jgi:hypothetical protein
MLTEALSTSKGPYLPKEKNVTARRGYDGATTKEN